MKKKISLAIALMLLAVVSATMLTGCWWLFKEEEKTGLEAGFRHPNYLGNIVAGAKSENTEFDLDDITLDFYYGLWRGRNSGPSDSDKKKYFIAVYFIKGGYIGSLRAGNFDDYKNIEGFYFVKDIPLDEFNSSSYAIKYVTPKHFAHSEQITVPREIIEDSIRDYFYFTVQIVIFDKQENKYEFDYKTSGSTTFTHNENTVRIYNKVLDDNKVQLSDKSI
ncbi:MAG: hypothetical protein LBP62_01600 [Clostridiales bacterium]|jgi:hypothetical protein|nr:hypothetical protein [Clostridiales bacterium]